MQDLLIETNNKAMVAPLTKQYQKPFLIDLHLL